MNKKVLVLRTCNADMTGYEGFKWPESGRVEAPDWKPTQDCGNGLHGWLWGSGNWNLKAKDDNRKWLVVEVDESEVINLNDKVKFRSGNVLFVSKAWNEAMGFIRGHAHYSASVVAEHVATGDSGHASATGNYGVSIAGYSGRAKADKNGCVAVISWDEKAQRPRLTVGYVGEDNIQANTWYQEKDGKLQPI